jgi:hypothetical protein
MADAPSMETAVKCPVFAYIGDGPILLQIGQWFAAIRA